MNPIKLYLPLSSLKYSKYSGLLLWLLLLTDCSLAGELAKQICQCYIRSLPWGTKYINQTLPRFLTLWLDLGEKIKLVPEHGNECVPVLEDISTIDSNCAPGLREFRQKTHTNLETQLKMINDNLIARYVDKIPAYMVCFPHYCCGRFG